MDLKCLLIKGLCTLNWQFQGLEAFIVCSFYNKLNCKNKWSHISIHTNEKAFDQLENKTIFASSLSLET